MGGNKEKGLHSRMQKDSALQCSGKEAFKQTGVGLSGGKDAEISQEPVLACVDTLLKER